MLSFIDISGDFNAKPDKQKYIVAASVTIKQRSIGEITRKVHNLKRDILANETLEIKASSFVNHDTLDHPEKNKFNFIDNLAKTVLNDPDCYYSAIVIQNEDIKPTFPRDRLSKHYIYLLQRINFIAESENRRTVIIVIDNNNRQVDKWAAYAFNNYLYRTSDGKQMDRILEVPIFADSEMTVGIQLADLAAGIIRNYYTENLNNCREQIDNSMYWKKLDEYFQLIYEKAPCSGALKGIYEAPPGFLTRFYK